MEPDSEQLVQMMAEVCKNELREDDSTRNQLLAQFRDWIHKNPNIIYCRTDDTFLLAFLRMKKFSLPMAQQTLLKFIKLRQTFSHFMCGLDIQDKDIDAVFCSGFVARSPYRDDKGRSVVIANYGNMDLEKQTVETFTRAVQLSNAALMEDKNTQIMGITHVCNFMNADPKIFSSSILPELFEFIRAGESTTPMRHKEIIFFNVPHYAVIILNAVKRILSKKLQERFFVFNTLEELHERVNPKCLPKDLGGTLTIQEMAGLWKKEVALNRQTFIDLDKIKLRDLKLVDLNTKSATISGLNGIQGSFRKLQID